MCSARNSPHKRIRIFRRSEIFSILSVNGFLAPIPNGNATREPTEWVESLRLRCGGRPELSGIPVGSGKRRAWGDQPPVRRSPIGDVPTDAAGGPNAKTDL